jgi:hypothetical protein
MMLVAWVTATTLAGAVEWAAVTRLDRQGAATAARPLSPSDVRQRLDRVTAAQPDVPTRSSRPKAAQEQSRTKPQPASSRRTRRTVGQSARSWQLTGGRVGIACRGPAIGLLYASPLDGWTYRLDQQTRATISLEFLQGRVTAGLTARCVRGVPTRVVGVPHDHETGSEDSSGD